MGKKGAASKAKEAAVASPSSRDSFLESLNAEDRRLAESVGIKDATALASEKAKMEARSKKAHEAQRSQVWQNQKREAWEKENDKKLREKAREDKQWDQQVKQTRARALAQGVLESQEHMDGSWYVQVGKDTWTEVQDKYYCTLCEKHLNDSTLLAHIESKDHGKKVAWLNQGVTTCPKVPAPAPQQQAAACSGAAASAAGAAPGAPLEPWQELGTDGWQVRCIPCDKVIDECHLATADHTSRLQAWQERQNVLRSGYQAPALPYLAYVPADPAFPAGERWMRCLLCKKWVQDEYSHSGTHTAPDGSKEHRKNLINYPPNDPWYEENVTREKLKYHPEVAPTPAPRQAPTPAPWANSVPTPIVSWTNAAAAAASAPCPAAPTAPTAAAPAELPKGWHTTTDPGTGKAYYYHSETNEVRWDPPTVNEC